MIHHSAIFGRENQCACQSGELCQSLYLIVKTAIARPAGGEEATVRRSFLVLDYGRDVDLSAMSQSNEGELRRRTVDRSHWSPNEIEDCLLAPKKRKCKPFAPACPNIGIVRRGTRRGVH